MAAFVSLPRWQQSIHLLPASASVGTAYPGFAASGRVKPLAEAFDWQTSDTGVVRHIVDGGHSMRDIRRVRPHRCMAQAAPATRRHRRHHHCPVSVIASDDLRLIWADAKPTEKMILRSLRQPGPLMGEPTTRSYNRIFLVTLRRHLPSILRHGQITGVSTENRPTLLRPNNHHQDPVPA